MISLLPLYTTIFSCHSLIVFIPDLLYDAFATQDQNIAGLCVQSWMEFPMGVVT